MTVAFLKTLKKVFANAGRALLVLMALLLIVYLITILSGSSAFFTDSAEKNAKLYFEEDLSRAEALADRKSVV